MLFLKAQVATTFTLTYDYCVLDGTKCFAGASTIHKNKYIKLFKQILPRIPLFCSIFMEKTMSISFARQRCFFFFFFLNWALLDTRKWFHVLPEWIFLLKRQLNRKKHFLPVFPGFLLWLQWMSTCGVKLEWLDIQEHCQLTEHFTIRCFSRIALCDIISTLHLSGIPDLIFW